MMTGSDGDQYVYDALDQRVAKIGGAKPADQRENLARQPPTPLNPKTALNGPPDSVNSTVLLPHS